MLEEVYICTQHLDGITYSDVLAMPIYERRYFLNLKSRDINKQKEHYKEQTQTAKSNSKGNRTTTVSGDALKNKMKNGDIPLN